MSTLYNKTKCGLVAIMTILMASCSFLEQQTPQGALPEDQVKSPELVDNLVISAYAIFMTAEDINSSFSMWNYDVRSDDAYKGGSSQTDGGVFHQLEIEKGILTSNWNISDMWVRLYNCISRVNMAISVLEKMDDSYELRNQRLGEMYFLRGYGHFMLKRLYKFIPFITDANLTPEQYGELSNRAYSNDEGWQLIIDDFRRAYNTLPESQEDKGRPTKAAAAAFMAKTFLYKAYHQDNANSHQVTSINLAEMDSVIKYTNPEIYTAAGFTLEPDFHNNFRPEPAFENGVESIWAIQYSMNDGTQNGNCNWSYGLIVPNIPGVTDGGCDFYKPSQNLVNAFKTDVNGLPMPKTFNNADYQMKDDEVDPRLFLTVCMPNLPYMFNPKYMMKKNEASSRSGGLYGYNITVKHNVDPDCGYLIKSGWWGSPMNRIVLRYADVVLERAEAYAMQGKNKEAMDCVNEIRRRAIASTGMISNYELDYGVKIRAKEYTSVPDQDGTIEAVRMERRLELAMESERFFDLVRWGVAEKVLNDYFAAEADNCAIYSEAKFTADKNEYLPIPLAQMAASNQHYQQNINW